ncbi:MAG: cytochrome c biogenesis protein CcdA [Candidatus Jorgensenbacteria bacterium]
MIKNKTTFVLIGIVVLLAAFLVFLKWSGGATTTIWNLSDGGKAFIPLLLVSALIDSVNPCAFSVLVLTIAFLFSIGRLRSGILKVGLAYILGIFVVYLLIGLGLLQALHLFNIPNFMGKFGSALLVLLGAINLVNVFFPRFPIKLKIPDAAHEKMAVFMEKASVPAAFALGGFVALCEFPCTGGPYLMVLGFLHDARTYISGFGYLILYNLIFVAPLALILGIAANETLLTKVQTWRKENVRGMHLWGGIAMVLLGFLIFVF